MARLYERWLAENEGAKTVPLVVPVLLYQGPSGWTLPQRLSEMLDAPPELLKTFPPPVELFFAVDDMSRSLLGEQVTHDQLVREVGLAMAEMARSMLWLHHHPEATTGDRAANLGRISRALAEGSGPEALEPYITYFISAFGVDTPLRDIVLESANQETRHMFVTIREQLIAEGVAKGVAEGVAKGKAVGLAEALERLLDTRGIQLTDDARQRITSCEDEAVLRRWFDRAVTASSVTEVFDD